MLIELSSASFNCVAFWKIDAEFEISCLTFWGGPLGGKSGCCSVGVTALEEVLEFVPERRPEEELDPELRDLSNRFPVFVRLTIRLDARVLGPESATVALVNVSV